MAIADRVERKTEVPVRDSSLHVIEPTPVRAAAKWCMACGIFLFVIGVYGLTSPGRIDMVDGQIRFDVAYNWLATGRPVVTDQWIGPLMGVPGRDGQRYSFYGAPASIFAMPLVRAGIRADAHDVQLSRFLFSLTSSIFGAAIAPLLFLFYLELGATLRRALAWTMVSSFATYVWAISSSTFDNAQHAFFALAAVYFAFLSGRRKSAAYALMGGLMAAVLFLYQEYFLLIIPILALPTLGWKSLSAYAPEPKGKPKKIISQAVSAVQGTFKAAVALVRSAWEGPGESRSSCLRYCLFFAVVTVGIALSMAYNDLRFGSWFDDGKITKAYPPLFGNPLAGLSTLLISPGKSVFLYSPTLVLGILGIRQLWRRAPELATAVVMASVTLVLFISLIACAGGDWCWGPRYLTPLLPLWALAFPFIPEFKFKRGLVFAIVLLGFVVQGLALSVENQRYFFEQGLNDFFWAEDPWFYMKHSALFTRVGEVASLGEGVPSTAQVFNSVPQRNWTTYSLLGPPPNVSRSLAPRWIRNFQIFFLPRPWPLWMSALPTAMRPVDVETWLVGLFSVIGAGAGLCLVGFRLTAWGNG